MKTKILTGIGFILIMVGAMMGDSQKVMSCLVCIAIGSIVLLIAVKTGQNAEEKEL
jgi:hypothetical protein